MIQLGKDDLIILEKNVFFKKILLIWKAEMGKERTSVFIALTPAAGRSVPGFHLSLPDNDPDNFRFSKILLLYV